MLKQELKCGRCFISRHSLIIIIIWEVSLARLKEKRKCVVLGGLGRGYIVRSMEAVSGAPLTVTTYTKIKNTPQITSIEACYITI